MVRWIRGLSAGAVAAVALIAGAIPARAESWGEPSRAFARYGIRSIVCDERTHDAPCLAIACRDGALALVSAAGGGGPMDGPTRISTGRTTLSLNFRYDEKAIDSLGVAASEVDLGPRDFDALLEATSLTLTLQSDPRVRHRFSTQGLTAAWNRAFKSCG